MRCSIFLLRSRLCRDTPRYQLHQAISRISISYGVIPNVSTGLNSRPARQKTRSFSGTIVARATRLRPATKQWKAEIAYDARQDGASFTGKVRLDLAIHRAIVDGIYEGPFSGSPIRGPGGCRRRVRIRPKLLRFWAPVG